MWSDAPRGGRGGAGVPGGGAVRGRVLPAVLPAVRGGEGEDRQPVRVVGLPVGGSGGLGATGQGSQLGRAPVDVDVVVEVVDAEGSIVAAAVPPGDDRGVGAVPLLPGVGVVPLLPGDRGPRPPRRRGPSFSKTSTMAPGVDADGDASSSIRWAAYGSFPTGVGSS